MATVETKFWTFNQNNSGGSFDFDEKAGITHFVIIEAVDRGHAVSRARDAGLYFNGCDTGQDCPCCGDRWSAPWGDDGDDEPEVYGRKVRGAAETKDGGMKPGKEICVHNIDGTLEWFGAR